MKTFKNKLIGTSLLNNQIIGAFLVVSYCLIYGITAQIVLSGIQLIFLLSSVLFALSILYVRDPVIQKEKARKGILFNQLFGTVLVTAYILFYGITSFTLLHGLQLLFFMGSFTFAMSMFYIRDPERIKTSEDASSSSSGFAERNPCFINSNDLSWLVREANGSLSVVIGFCELLLGGKKFSQNENEYMLRNIYQHSLNLSHTIDKVASIVPDSPAKPKEIHEVVDLLEDSNFKR